MGGFAFGHRYVEIHKLLEESTSLLEIHPNVDSTWLVRLAEAGQSLETKGRLRVVLTGQFSAGKSTLIQALTGMEVAISPGPTTREADEFEWKGISLVDTPGVNSDRDDTDHDRIARETTSGADLVLFVVSNELFSPRLQQYFSFLASQDGLGLASKMAVVINKMDREINSDEVIITEVAKAIEPYDHMPILLCSAKRYLELDRLPEGFRESHLQKSRIPELQDALDQFIRDNGAAGRLTTPLQVLEQVLADATSWLTTDVGVSREVEYYRRQARLFEKGRVEYDNLVRKYKAEIVGEALKVADATAGLLTEETQPDDVEAMVAEKMVAEVFPATEKVLDEGSRDIAAFFSDLEKQLEELGETPLGLAVRAEFSKEGGPASVGGAPRRSSDMPDRIVKEIKPLIQNQLKNALEEAAKNPKALRDLVYEIGKKLGKKFKPYEAVKMGEKLAKVAERVAGAIPWVLLGVDLVLTYREEKRADEKRKHLAKVRVALHRAFREQADREVKAFEQAAESIRHKAIDASLNAIHETIKTRLSEASARSQLVEQLEGVAERSRAVRRAVMSA